MNPSIALDRGAMRPNGTRQGCASPRPSAAPWTEPARPLTETLYEGDDRLTLNHLQPRSTNNFADHAGVQVVGASSGRGGRGGGRRVRATAENEAVSVSPLKLSEMKLLVESLKRPEKGTRRGKALGKVNR